MSETNGHGESRLDRIDASHVKLMTEHAVFVKEHEKWIAEQEREWERQKERWKQQEVQREEDRKRAAALDERIYDLVSAIGGLARRVPPAPKP